MNEGSLIQKREYYIELFSFYGNLLTDKQKEYFNDYYYNDYTISEISKNNNVSRSAIFDALSKINVLLDNYESILKLNFKANQRESIYKKYDNKNESICELINKLREIE